MAARRSPAPGRKVPADLRLDLPERRAAAARADQAARRIAAARPADKPPRNRFAPAALLAARKPLPPRKLRANLTPSLCKTTVWSFRFPFQSTPHYPGFFPPPPVWTISRLASRDHTFDLVINV